MAKLIPVASDIDHVRRLCDREDFPWAHSYVTRLIAEHPDDPEPLLLRAMVHARRGEPEAARRDLALADGAGVGPAPLRAEVEALVALPERGEIEDRAGEWTWRRGVKGLPWAVAAMAVVVLTGWGIRGAGSGIADGLGLPEGTDGDSFPGMLIVIGAIALLRLLYWWIKARLRGDGVRADLHRRRTLVRATAESLDDDNMRLNAAALASFLCLTPFFFPLPVLAGAGSASLVRVWTVLLVAALAGWVRWQVGGEQLGRAFRLSRLVVLHTVVAVGWAVAFVAAPLPMSSMDDGVGPYLLCWSLGGWLLSAPFLIVTRRRLSREGRLQVPSPWSGRDTTAT